MPHVKTQELPPNAIVSLRIRKLRSENSIIGPLNLTRMVNEISPSSLLKVKRPYETSESLVTK
jgi:hypothetical protein